MISIKFQCFWTLIKASSLQKKIKYLKMDFRLTKKEKLLKDERDMFSLLIIERFFYIYVCVCMGVIIGLN